MKHKSIDNKKYRALSKVFSSAFIALLSITTGTSFADYGDGSFISNSGTTSTSSTGSSCNSCSLMTNWAYYMGIPVTTTPTTIPTASSWTTATTTIPDLTDVTNTEYAASANFMASLGILDNPSTYSTVLPTSFASLGAAYTIPTTISQSPYSIWSTFASSTSSTSQSDNPSGLYPVPFSVGVPSTSSDGTTTTPIPNTLAASVLETVAGTFDTSLGIPGNSISSGYLQSSFTTPTTFSIASQLLNVPATVSDGNVTYNFNTSSFFTAPSEDDLAIFDPSTFMDVYNTNSEQASYAIKWLYALVAPTFTNKASYTTINNIVNNITSGIQTADYDTVNTNTSALFNYKLSNASSMATLGAALEVLQYIITNHSANPATGVSPWTSDATMVMRRMNNTAPAGVGQVPTNQWLTNMMSASPVAIAKEQLVLLNEINYQLFQTRVQNEKILFLLAVNVLGTAANDASSATNALGAVSSSSSVSSTS